MTIFLRSLPRPTALRSIAARFITVALAGSALLLCASPAGAHVTKIVTKAGTVEAGVQPRNGTTYLDGILEAGVRPVEPTSKTLETFGEEITTPASFANPLGDPVVHGSNVYVIYWDPADAYHADWQEVIDTFVQGVGLASGTRDNIFAVDTQYTDLTDKPAEYNFNYRGSYTDTHAYPTGEYNCTDPAPISVSEAQKTGPLTCVTDAQIQTELQRFIAEQKLPTGMNTIYYLLTPPGATVCLDSGTATGHCSDYAATKQEEKTPELLSENESYTHSFCSYHSAINPGAPATGSSSTVLYGVVPWTAGYLADGQIKTSHLIRKAYDCQDGAFDPSAKVLEEREHAKEETKAEKEVMLNGTLEEKSALKRARALEGPRQQEPNWGRCPSGDGDCDTGLADLIINQIAVEQQNIVTNPLLNAWQDSGGNEATDECRNFFAPTLGGASAASEETGAGSLFNQTFNLHDYYINDAFNYAALRMNYPGVPCVGGVNLAPHFTAPNPVSTGQIVGFDGMESDIMLDSAVKYSPTGKVEPNYATYSWNFGTTPRSSPVSHLAPRRVKRPGRARVRRASSTHSSTAASTTSP